MALERRSEAVTEIAFASFILPRNDADICTVRIKRPAQVHRRYALVCICQYSPGFRGRHVPPSLAREPVDPRERIASSRHQVRSSGKLRDGQEKSRATAGFRIGSVGRQWDIARENDSP